MTEMEADKVRELITNLCNRAKGQLPQGASVTMIARMLGAEGMAEQFIITNDRDPLALLRIILKLLAGDHPDVVSDIKVPIEPIHDKWDDCLPGCLKPIYRGPITHAPHCPNEEGDQG